MRRAPFLPAPSQRMTTWTTWVTPTTRWPRTGHQLDGNHQAGNPEESPADHPRRNQGDHLSGNRSEYLSELRARKWSQAMTMIWTIESKLLNNQSSAFQVSTEIYLGFINILVHGKNLINCLRISLIHYGAGTIACLHAQYTPA